MTEQQASRTRKNCLQKALLFSKRAQQLVESEDQTLPFKKQLYRGCMFNMLCGSILYLMVWCLPVRYGAWMKATEEHNAYGAAATNIAYRISQESADQLFAFKVTWLNDLQCIAFEICIPANDPMPPHLGRVTSHSAFHRVRRMNFDFL